MSFPTQRFCAKFFSFFFCEYHRAIFYAKLYVHGVGGHPGILLGKYNKIKANTHTRSLPVGPDGVEGMELAEGEPVQEEGEQLVGEAVRKHRGVVVAINLQIS